MHLRLVPGRLSERASQLTRIPDQLREIFPQIKDQLRQVL